MNRYCTRDQANVKNYHITPILSVLNVLFVLKFIVRKKYLMDLQIVRKWTSEDEAIFMPFFFADDALKQWSGGFVLRWFRMKNQQSFYVDDSIINSALNGDFFETILHFSLIEDFIDFKALWNYFCWIFGHCEVFNCQFSSSVCE